MSDSALNKQWVRPLLQGIAAVSSIAASSFIVTKLTSSIQSKEQLLNNLTQQVYEKIASESNKKVPRINAKKNVNKQGSLQVVENQADAVSAAAEDAANSNSMTTSTTRQQSPPKKFLKLSNHPTINVDGDLPQLAKSKSFAEASQIYKICITGGPCAGKTSGLVMLSEKLREAGFNVFTVPESATLIANAGGQINMESLSVAQKINIQKAILKSQAQLEESFINIAKLARAKSVVLCDRGMMDGSAYLEHQDWTELLDSMGLTEVQLRDKRYDCVIHLVTAGDGAEKFYNKDNDARYESPQEAIVIDRKLQLAWLGHPNYSIIDNFSCKNFEDKLEILTNKVRLAVGLPGKFAKKSKRFLIESFDSIEDLIKKHQKKGSKSSNQQIKIQRFYIEDTFIQNHVQGGWSSDPDSNLKTFTKVRRRGQQQQYVYNWSQSKYDKKDVLVARQMKQLNSKEYLFMVSQQDQTRISLLKERVCFMQNNISYIVDTFFNVKEGFSILKMRVEENQKVITPDFLPIAREVTGEKGYSSKVLSKKNWYAPTVDETILNYRKDSM